MPALISGELMPQRGCALRRALPLQIRPAVFGLIDVDPIADDDGVIVKDVVHAWIGCSETQGRGREISGPEHFSRRLLIGRIW
jgi:hypothetical protein